MSISDWTSDKAFKRELGATNAPAFPHEYLVKTLSSSSNSGLLPLPISSRILEIGCFGANNLRFFWEKGYHNLYGIEVTPSLVTMAQTSAKHLLGSEFPHKNILCGHNLSLPFPDNYFDLIISINTIHYSSGDDVRSALRLWKSKLTDSGRLFVETAGPMHDYVLDSIRLDTHMWKWGTKAGFRSGTFAGFFDGMSHFESALSAEFSEVSIGRVTEVSKNNTVDFMTGYCVN